jgi:hypothetical protein
MNSRPGYGEYRQCTLCCFALSKLIEIFSWGGVFDSLSILKAITR